MLAISREQFREFYKGTPEEHNERLFYDEQYRSTLSDEEFFYKTLSSELYCINFIYKITPKKGSRLTNMLMNYGQHYVYSQFLKHPRLAILKARQIGISTLFLLVSFHRAITTNHFSAGLIAQDLDIAKKLLGRIKTLWNTLPDDLKFNRETGEQLKSISMNMTEISFNNNSFIYVKTSFRGGTLQFVHVSEMGAIAQDPEKADELMSGTLEAIESGLPVVLESTARGKNLFYEIYDKAEKTKNNPSEDDFYPVFLPWFKHPTYVTSVEQDASAYDTDHLNKVERELNITLTPEQRNWWIMKHRAKGNTIHREYPASAGEAFKAVREGAFFSKMYKAYVVDQNKEVEKLYDPHIELSVSMDIGIHGYFVLCFFQVWENHLRIVDEFWAEGENLQYYMKKLLEYPRPIDNVYFPHDMEVRDLSAPGSKTRKQIAEDCGVSGVVLGKKPLEDSVEESNTALMKCYFDKKCTYLIDCMNGGYQRKWIEKAGQWSDKAVENRYKHGADAFRYAVQAFNSFHKQRPRDEDDEYSYRSGDRREMRV